MGVVELAPNFLKSRESVTRNDFLNTELKNPTFLLDVMFLRIIRYQLSKTYIQ